MLFTMSSRPDPNVLHYGSGPSGVASPRAWCVALGLGAGYLLLLGLLLAGDVWPMRFHLTPRLRGGSRGTSRTS